MKIALTGATGLVGSKIVELLNTDFEFLAFNHNQVDITNKQSVVNFLQDKEFDLFLHLAAYTNVDKAETEKELCYNLNVNATKNLWEIVKTKNKPFIFISTDFVFDGVNPPFTEDSLPHPLGYYAQTKYEAEQIVKNQAMIVRISYPYKKFVNGKKDFVNRIKEILEQRQTVKGITDSTFTPTFIDDIAFGLKYLFRNFTPEIYHLVGKDSLSPYEAARQIAKTFSLNEELVQPITLEEYFKDKAPRPKHCRVISRKNTFQPMQSFYEGLYNLL